MDSLHIRVETDKPTKEMAVSLTRELTSTLMGLKPELELVSVGTLPRQEKKTKRLIDERKY
jgi:phenylacetate-CoA ligase